MRGKDYIWRLGVDAGAWHKQPGLVQRLGLDAGETCLWYVCEGWAKWYWRGDVALFIRPDIFFFSLSTLSGTYTRYMEYVRRSKGVHLRVNGVVHARVGQIVFNCNVFKT